MDDAVTVEVKDPVASSEAVTEAADSEETATGSVKQVEKKPHRWKKGQSGNPKGRPKLPTFAEMANVWLDKPCNQETMQTRRERLVAVLGSAALNGDMKAMKEFLARVWPQTIRLRDETPPQQITMVMVAEQPPKDWDPEAALLQGSAPVLPGAEETKDVDG